MAYVNRTVPFYLGPDGLIGTRSPNVAGPTFLLAAEGITYEDELIQKEGGCTKYNAAALSGNPTPSVLAGHDWWPTTAAQRMVIYTSAGALLKDAGDGTFGVTLKSGLRANPAYPPVFVEAGKEAAASDRKLFIFNGYDTPQVLSADGATTANLTTPPADWATTNQPAFGCLHERRVWGGGNANDPHRLYYSSTTDHAVFTGTDSGSLSIFPGEGEALVGAISYGNWIVCWKRPSGIYVVDTTDPTPANWRVNRLSSSVGAVSPRGVVMVGDEVVFIDQNGSFHTASTIEAYAKIGTGSLSAPLRLDTYMRGSVNLSLLSQCQAIYYPNKQEAHFAMTPTGATVNKLRLVWDFNNPQRPRVRYSTRDTPVSLWLRRDANNILRPMMGDNAGFVWHLDQTARSKAGSAYATSFTTAPTDLSYVDPALAGKRKNGEFLELHYMPTGEFNVYVEAYWDNIKGDSIAFNLGGASTITLGTTFVLGSAVLGGPTIAAVRKRLAGSGRRLHLTVSSNTVGENFALAGALLGFSVGDERD